MRHYVYADNTVCKCLYVGTLQECERYKKLVAEQEAADKPPWLKTRRRIREAGLLRDFGRRQAFVSQARKFSPRPPASPGNRGRRRPPRPRSPSRARCRPARDRDGTAQGA